MPVILAIESSCDETAVAVVRGESGQAAEVLASEISSQIDLDTQVFVSPVVAGGRMYILADDAELIALN